MGSESKDEFARPRRPKLRKKRPRNDSEASTATVEIKSSMLVDPIKRKRRNVYNPEEESRYTISLDDPLLVFFFF